MVMKKTMEVNPKPSIVTELRKKASDKIVKVLWPFSDTSLLTFDDDAIELFKKASPSSSGADLMQATQAIADAEAKISDLTTRIEELTAGSARLNTEIRNTEKEVAKNQESLDQATAVRQKQLAEFNGEETTQRDGFTVRVVEQGVAEVNIRQKQLAKFNGKESSVSDIKTSRPLLT